ncbi:hypothetical protein [Microvirga rosea]|uniref:hypothetical protein n=1 Tax=Microvirga rosea TaxID=2715425 RepID=UPI001D0B9209|nr:hypothetical protein [Microvirga rosea]MCB8819541.1 hypothetical protein [Microvirga rosea]
MPQPCNHSRLGRCLQALLLLVCLSWAHLVAFDDSSLAQAALGVAVEETLGEADTDFGDDGDEVRTLVPVRGAVLPSIGLRGGTHLARAQVAARAPHLLATWRATGPPRA